MSMSGPMARPVELPARTRPGRKPMPDAVVAGQDRRRGQNRESQRRYRDRRNEKLDAIEKVNTELRADRNNQESARRKAEEQLQKSESARRAAEAQVEELQRQVDSLQNQVNSLRLQPLHAAQSPRGASNSSPADRADSGARFDTSEDFLEKDFTTQYKSVSEPCGFCTDVNNCACIAAKQPPSAPQAGGCDDCLANPLQAAACRRMAALAETPSPRSMGAESRIPCSEFLGRANERGLMSRLQELEPARLNPRHLEGGRWETSETEAANALTLLQASKPARKFTF
ncbi:uncharacterized protein LTR77_006727 [Saxophila tyrrhenica]|uniref:BZIP domain-containing protein n=1 Tax=Saxophila tyrrhenica TaxID=1690608 RepID=A0AAV9P6C6_9PEZI|nr:hypothetical protein LTR77_006727 [Saxophila tyrrhenica]